MNAGTLQEQIFSKTGLESWQIKFLLENQQVMVNESVKSEPNLIVKFDDIIWIGSNVWIQGHSWKC